MVCGILLPAKTLVQISQTLMDEGDVGLQIQQPLKVRQSLFVALLASQQ